MSNDNKEEISRLESILDNADVMYYTFGESELSDSEYDAYVDRLKVIDPKNKRFKNKKVGAKEDKNSQWEKYEHNEYKMGSQSKVNTFEDFKSWAKNETSFIVQEKLDGISIKLIYKDGKLQKGITRGDGLKGEDITTNVYKMDIPRKIDDKRELILRGEILLYHSKIDCIGGKNARNSAAGTSKRLDGKGCEYLSIQVYDIMNWKELGHTSNEESVKLLKDLGFNVVNTYICQNVNECQDIMDLYIQNKRSQLDWDIDGLVIKYNEYKSDDWAYPKRSIAYKFPNQTITTKLLDVIWRDSGGRISPIGILEPVDLCGVTISRATLNNTDYIKKLGVKIGDTVLISRRNDVIPAIEKVVVSTKNNKEIVPPTHDEDGFPIERERNSEGKELVYLISTNPNSKSKRCRRILSWFTTHEIKGIANATIEAIVDANIAYDLPDFLDVCLNGDQRLLELDGFGKSTFKLLRQSALKTSKTSIIKFLVGCNLSGFGEKRFQTILENINKKITLEELLYIIDNINTIIADMTGFGNNTALSLKNSINKNKYLLKEMVKRIEVEPWEPGQINVNSKIAGKSFCFTGKMNHDRNTLEKMVKENGGLVLGVSKKLDYLVTNDPNSGSSKNKKADQLGISKITEENFLNIIREG